MPVRRKTMSAAARKRAAAKRKATLRRNAAAAAGRKRKCSLSSAVMSDGSCKSMPCLDEFGNPVPFSVRGRDGECRIKTCGPGMIMSHKTGKCVSTKTPEGRLMYLAKKYDDAKRFVSAYDESATSLGVPANEKEYYDQFDANAFSQRQRDERKRWRDEINKRAQKAHDERIAREKLRQRNSTFFQTFSNNMRNGDGKANGAGGRRSGGSSFSFF